MPLDDLDLFVYDSVFLYDFLEKGYLLPLEEEDIQDIDDFIPCALSACQADGITYALPQLLCTDLLYTRKEDIELSEVKNIRELYQIISSGQTADALSDENGLLMNTPDAVTYALWYLEVQTDLKQDFSEWSSIPEADKLDPSVLEILMMVQEMVRSDQMTDSDQNRGSKFAEGHGRAFIGFSEDMCVMWEAADDMVFRRFSLSDGEDIPMLYADIASINAGISDEKRPLAVELLNIITGTEALAASFSPAEADQYPQYLLAARWSIYDTLAEHYPIYSELKEVVSDPRCKVFIVRSGGREMVEQAISVFQKHLRG